MGLLKVGLVGAAGSGKGLLSKKFSNSVQPIVFPPPLNLEVFRFEVFTKDAELEDNETQQQRQHKQLLFDPDFEEIDLNQWNDHYSSKNFSLLKFPDKAYQERLNTRHPIMVLCDAFIVLYDVTSRASWDQARFWVNSIKKTSSTLASFSAGLHHKQAVKTILLVGNKIDLPVSEREVDFNEVKEFSELEKIGFFEVSVLYDINLFDLFACIFVQMMKNYSHSDPEN
eukprot:TRINITY_DN6579_c0_g1_i1.p1 TRINITY_DN6579_c0_g1~~TRINITY_DN6579_c0_g1_i1.p1  ORF type:complete len:227 (+),score=43.76 TRINITY_DN6579_c0_g1_i1:38-718(+)